MQKIVDTATGEFQDLQDGERAVVLSRGDRVLRENSLKFRKLSNRRFLKLYRLPSELTKTEYKIMMSVLTPDHIRANDNVIVHSNGKTADRVAIAAFAGMVNSEVFRRAMRGLKKKGVIAETKTGLALNPEYATIASNTLDRDTYDAFYGK
jgi:hypothetical protein